MPSISDGLIFLMRVLDPFELQRFAISGALTALLTVAPLIGGTELAQAGPCSAKIDALDRELRRLQAAHPPSGAGEVTGPQSIGAQLHHQPTPQSVESAAGKAKADAAAALERARKADAAGDEALCARALQDVRDIYGIN
jgi:hypothetical protein